MTKIHEMTSTKTILLGYCCIILLGAMLLTLPAATRAGVGTSFLDAVFTAASAACVTGLVRFDTYTYWSSFGQMVLLLLIQIGGIGFMTFAISFATILKQRIGLNKRFIMQESVSAPQLGGIVRLTWFILFGTLLVECVGAVLLSFRFCPVFGFAKGIYFSVFHSVSAFCNAGFDLMGEGGEFSSLTSMCSDPYVNLVIMLLIIVGGLGFFVWADILKNRFRFKYLKLHAKIVLCVTALLIITGAALLFLFEQGGEVLRGKTAGQEFLICLFQSVTPRTAGFNTVDMAKLTQSSQLLIICLMMIGGSPGSTAGGLKTTTFAVSALSVFTVFKRKKTLECFGRRIDDESLRSASCVFMLYLLLTIVSTLVVSSTEKLPVLTAMFETVSAIGTVGLSLGITPSLGYVSQVILILLMIFGRVGSITMLLAFASNSHAVPSRLPLEKIRIG